MPSAVDARRLSQPPRLLHVARVLIRRTAYVVLILVVWIALGLPVGLDRWLDASMLPAKAEAIVCLAGGVTDYNTPLDVGWDRVYAASQLFADGFAPYVVFTGRGSGRLSEAEVYRDAAVWMGVPGSATIVESAAQSTAEHPSRVLAVVLPDGRRLSRESSILVVTSDYHSRRTLMTFQHAGFHNVRVVTNYRSSTPTGRRARVSGDPGYQPSHKRYGDPVSRFVDRSNHLVLLAREVAAIALYRAQGVL